MSDNNTKARLLFLERYLLEHTDEQHMLTSEELVKVYELNGYKANRNTVRDDIQTLQEQGIDVISDQQGKAKAFYVGARLFENAELKTLVDAVLSSRFITAEKSEALIRKIAQLTNVHNREMLLNGSLEINRLKTDSIGIFRTIDTINTAISENRKIRFQYIDYLPNKEEILRHDGKWYVVSPQALLWNDDRYYSPAYSDEKKIIIPYRIDRMRNTEIIDEPAIKVEGFNVAEYSRKVLHMYDGDVKEQKVTLQAENKYLLNVIDRFGEDIETKQIDDNHFSAEITVRPSSTFYAWVFQFCGKVKIVSPKNVIEGYNKMLFSSRFIDY